MFWASRLSPEWADELNVNPRLTDKDHALEIDQNLLVKSSLGYWKMQVYKQTEEGQAAFMRFVNHVGLIP